MTKFGGAFGATPVVLFNAIGKRMGLFPDPLLPYYLELACKISKTFPALSRPINRSIGYFNTYMD